MSKGPPRPVGRNRGGALADGVAGVDSVGVGGAVGEGDREGVTTGVDGVPAVCVEADDVVGEAPLVVS